VKAPSLRFKKNDGNEFSDWEKVTLGSIAQFRKGKGISKADIDDDGKTPCIRYGELYTHYGETIKEIKSKTNVATRDLMLSEVNDVIIPASGETSIDIATAACIQVADVALGGDLNIIKSRENGVFLSYYLNSQKKLDIAKLAQGNSVIHLYSSQLKILELNLPSISEQTKIADFLSSIDKKISQLIQKNLLLAQYKKAVIKKIFSRKIRFKDKDNQDFPEWEEVQLGMVFKDFKGFGLSKDKIGKIGKNKCILYGHLFTKYSEVITKVDSFTDFDEGLISEIGDILMPSSTTTNGIDLAKASSINEANILLGGDIIVLRLKKKGNSDFFAYLLTHAKSKEISAITQGVTIIHLYFRQLKNILINYPTINEQTKIADYLTAIDEKITTVHSQLDLVKQYKQGLLQQMFV
jgi:type I restriction enzyme, S subunit